jgi:hypothetical protein
MNAQGGETCPGYRHLEHVHDPEIAGQVGLSENESLMGKANGSSKTARVMLLGCPSSALRDPQLR